MPRSYALSIAFITILGACSQNGMPGEQGAGDAPAGNTGGLTSTEQVDWNEIEKLEAQAKAVAKIDGCASSAECRTAPVGSRGCGGPRYYIPWCATTTDSAALYAKLDAVAKAEQAYNAKYSVASTCEMRLAPAVEVSGGSCVTPGYTVPSRR